jgi:hypothetical protein
MKLAGQPSSWSPVVNKSPPSARPDDRLTAEQPEKSDMSFAIFISPKRKSEIANQMERRPEVDDVINIHPGTASGQE